MKKIFKILGILLLAIIIIGVIGGANNKNSNQAKIVSIENSANSTKANDKPKDVTPKVGDVTELGDRQFTVNSVRRSKAFGYNTPKTGKEYVIVNVTIRNLGKDEVSYNPFDFKVQDANGAQESSTYASLDDMLSSGTLAPEGKVTGSISFEVPIGDEAKLIFQPSFWNKQRVVVDLGNK